VFNLLALTVLISVCAIATNSWAKKPYKIGAIFPLTGPAASIGKQHLEGAKIAVEEINARGGIEGRKVELVVGDTQAKPAETVSLIDRLVYSEKVVAIIGPSLANTSYAVLDPAKYHKVPLLSLSGYVQVNDPFNPWTFRIGKGNEVVTALVSDYMKTKNLKSVGLITVDNMLGRAFEKKFRSFASARGIKVVKSTTISPELRDLSSSLIKISEGKPEAMLAWAYSNQLVNIAKVYKIKGLKPELYFGKVTPLRQFSESAGGAAEQIIIPSEKVMIASQLSKKDLQRPLIENFIKRSQRMNFKFPPELGGDGYDAVRLLEKAIRGSGGEKEKIRLSLEQIRGFIGVGGVYSFSSTNHSGLGLESLALSQIRNGKPYFVYSKKGCPSGTILCLDKVCRKICD